MVLEKYWNWTIKITSLLSEWVPSDKEQQCFGHQTEDNLRALYKESLHKTRYPIMIHRILCCAEPAGIWHRKLTTVQQELFGQGVVRLSPQGQCNWGYHRLYAAIHHSESNDIMQYGERSTCGNHLREPSLKNYSIIPQDVAVKHWDQNQRSWCFLFGQQERSQAVTMEPVRKTRSQNW